MIMRQREEVCRSVMSEGRWDCKRVAQGGNRWEELKR